MKGRERGGVPQFSSKANKPSSNLYRQSGSLTGRVHPEISQLQGRLLSGVIINLLVIIYLHQVHCAELDNQVHPSPTGNRYLGAHHPIDPLPFYLPSLPPPHHL